jgi:nitrite reductase/ring-hydroxylating ferredoxin subunit
MKGVDLQGSPVGIANVDGRFYAFSNACPNLDCLLTDGRLEGMTLTCSRHGSQFDLASGHVIKGPAIGRIRTYRVQTEGDELHI